MFEKETYSTLSRCFPKLLLENDFDGHRKQSKIRKLQPRKLKFRSSVLVILVQSAMGYTSLKGNRSS